MQEGDADAALAKLAEAVAIDPANNAARADYLKLLLQSGHLAEARRTYDPVAAQVLPDARLSALGTWLTACERAAVAPPLAQLDAAIAANRRDFAARYERALLLMAQQDFTAAMDELLEILMRDKAWADESARKTYVAILELMTKPVPKAEAAQAKGALELTGKAAVPPADPVIDQYRRKLSMALF